MSAQQQQINYGNTANDGQGDPLRTAFIKVDDNFDAIWNAGPVGSNITVLNNTVSVANANGNLAIRANGIGVIETSSSLVPRLANSYDIGSATLRYRSLYVGSGGANVTGNLVISGATTLANDVTVGGNLTVDGDVIQLGNITTDSKTIQLANTAATDAAADGAGVTVGANDDIATMLYDSINDAWVTNIALEVTGNVDADYFIGNGSLLTGIAASYGNTDVAAYLAAGLAGSIIPSANAVYSLGNSSAYWSNLWVANNTIYIGGVPLGVTGNVLTVNGEPVLSNDSDSSITTTGNITANYFIGNGSQLTGTVPLSNVSTYINVANVQGGSSSSYKIPFTALEQGGITQLEIDDIGPGLAYSPANGMVTCGNLRVTGNITAGDNSNISTLSCNVIIATGNITTTTGNIAAGNILTDNYLYANGAPFVSASTGNITFSDTTMSPPDGVDITISAANSEVIIEAFDIRLDATDDLRLTGNDIVSLRNRSTTDSITIRTDYDNNDYGWEFAADGTLTTPGDIVTAGDVTGTAGASTLYFKAQPASNTYIQLNNSVDSVISTVANLEVRTDVSNTAQVWSFDTTGNLTAPGNITTTGNITGNFILADLQVIATGDVTGSNIVGISSVQTANVYATNEVSATGNVIGGNLTTTGSVSATGNITANGNVSADRILTNSLLSETDVFVQALDGLVDIRANGNVVIKSADANYEWLFDDAGVLTTPGNISGLSTSDSTPPQSVTISAGDNTGGDLFNAANGGTLTLRGGDSGFNPGGALQLRGGNGSVDGDIIIGDITTTSVKIGNTSITANVVGNLTVGTNASVTGNVTGGNASLSGQIFAASAAVTGNITAGNFIGAGANVELVAGSYTWTFDNTGNVAFANGTITANDITLTGNIDANVGGYNIGYREIPQVTLSANANVALADSGKHFYSTTAGNLSLLIPTNANVAFPTGTAFTIVVQAAGNVLVNADSGVNLYLAGNSTAGNRVVSTYGMATVMKVASDTWFINGTGVA